MLVKGLIFCLVIILTSADPDADPNVKVKVVVKVDDDGCCPGCCPEYQCKDGVNGKCRKECRGDETNSMVGCDAKNGDDCNLKCCIETEEGCWNPITKMWDKNGTIVDFGGCTCEICINGIWEPHPDVILRRCVRCMVFGEPHFQAFNGALFDWHIPCNHALAQEGFTNRPAFGVFMDFDQIGGSSTSPISRVGPTTYKEGGTFVRMNPIISRTTVYVETGKNPTRINFITSSPTLLQDSSGPTTVWAWNSWYCIWIYGKHGILIAVCPWITAIWAPENNSGYPLLGGLCSSNNLDWILVARDGVTYSPPWPFSLCNSKFGKSWQTQISGQPGQIKSGCPETRRRKKRDAEDPLSECRNSTNSHYLEDCQRIIRDSKLTDPDADTFFKNCVIDLCAAILIDNPEKLTYNEVLQHYRDITKQAKEQEENTIDCVQDKTCKDEYGECKLINDDTKDCDPSLCSGKKCTCCKILA